MLYFEHVALLSVCQLISGDNIAGDIVWWTMLYSEHTANQFRR